MSVEAEQLQFYQAFMFTFGATAVIATVAWWRARRRVRELTRQRDEKERSESDIQGRLDDLAVEVERIGEGQRYLAKTLLAADRASAIKEVPASGLQQTRANRAPDR